ncbi:YadA-like family protein [Mannheimia pernigra]|uniref:YadA-like family protein n=1 Tax=Mannheimia pernigra TaxID=111844 RepID=A0A7D5IWW3_9PAST|nr:YadA-like family protein [Mannheimia pernigra]QLB41118.1 YadA-like family protein [Mannheimia pernigra]
MNKIYRVVFNKSTQTFQAVCEYASAQGKSTTTVGTTAATSTSERMRFTLIMSSLILSTYGFAADGNKYQTPIVLNQDAYCYYDAASTSVICGDASTTATGNNAVALGKAATASINAVAIGLNAIASVQNATAIGPNSSANGSGAIAIGFQASATRWKSIAIGELAQATGLTSTAIGAGSKAINDNATALGLSSTASGDSTTAIGKLATASHWESTALGNLATASGGSSTALGTRATASGESSVATGQNSTASGLFSTSLGSLAIASEAGSTAIGYFSKATGNTAIALGYRAAASGRDAVALGNSVTASGGGAVAIGNSINVSGENVIAIGSNHPRRVFLAQGSGDIVIGHAAETWASKEGGYQGNMSIGNLSLVGHGAKTNNISIGNNSRVVGEGSSYSVVLGDSAALGAYNIALGIRNSVTNSAIAIGRDNLNAGNLSSAVGAYNTIGSQYSGAVAMGVGNVVGARYATAIGNGALVFGEHSGVFTSAGHDQPSHNIRFAGTHRAAETGTSIVGGTNNFAIGNYNVVGSSSNNNMVLGNQIKVGATNARADVVPVRYLTLQDPVTKEFVNTEALVEESIGPVAGNKYYIFDKNAADNNYKGKLVYSTNGNGVFNTNITLDDPKYQGKLLLGNAYIEAREVVPVFENTVAIENAIAIGQNANVGASNAIAQGKGAQATGEGSIAVGKDAQATGTQSISIGTGNQVKGNNSGAFGDPSIINAENSYSVGNNNKLEAGQSDVFALGNSITQTTNNSVFLGKESAYTQGNSTAGLVKAADANINGLTYGSFAGNSDATTGVVSVGDVNKERRIQNVAAGLISATSTDAINGSQLHSIIKDGRFELFANGTADEIKQGTQVNGQPKDKVADVRWGDKLNLTSADQSVTIAGSSDEKVRTLDFKVNIDEITITKTQDGKLTANTTTLEQDPNKTGAVKALDTDNANKLVKAGDIAKAINESGFVAMSGVEGTGQQLGAKANTLIKSGETVTYKAGDNLSVKQEGANFTFATKEAVNFTTVTTGDTVMNEAGISINNGAAGKPVKLTKNGLDNGGNTITNVKAGVDETDVANVKQVKDARTTVKSSNNSISVVDTNQGANDKNLAYDITVNNQAVVDNAQTPVVYTNKAGVKLYKVNGTFNTQADGSGEEVAADEVLVSINNGRNSTEKPVTLRNVLGNLEVTTSTDTFTKAKQAPNLVDQQRMNNQAATVGDVLNAGFNLQGNSQAVDFVKAYDTINFVDGNVTTATVTTDGKTSKIQYDVKVDDDTIKIDGDKIAANTTTLEQDPAKTGAIKTPDTANANKLVKAGDIAKAINESGFVATSGVEDSGKQLGRPEDKLVKSGDKVAFKAGKNLSVKQEGASFTFATQDDVNFTSVTTGNTVMDDAGISINNGAAGKVVKLTKDGLDNGGNTITNVKEGVNETDVANVKQVKDLRTTIESSNNSISVVNKNANDTEKNFAYDITINNQAVVENAQTPVVYTNKAGVKLYKLANGTFNTQADGNGEEVAADEVLVSINNGRNSTNTPVTLRNVLGNLEVTTSTDTFTKAKQAPNLVDQQRMNNQAATVGDVLNAGFNLKGKGLEKDFVRAYDTIDFVDGNATTAKVTTDGKTSTIQYDVKVDNDTIKIDGEKIAANTTTLEQDPAKTGAIKTPDTANANKLVKAGDIAKAINESGFVATSGVEDSGKQLGRPEDKLVKSGDKVAFKAGNNLTVKQEGANFTFATQDDVNFTTVTTGNTVMNDAGISINNGAAGKPVKLTKNGLDNGGNTIKNVKAGEKDTDAVNVAQLNKAIGGATTQIEQGKNVIVKRENGDKGQAVYTVHSDSSKVTQGDGIVVTHTVESDENGVKTNDYNVALSEDTKNQLKKEESVTSEDTNLLVDNTTTNETGAKEYKLSLNKNLDLTENGLITIGDSKLNKEGLAIEGGPTVKKSGIDAGGQKIANLKDGLIEKGSKDAVNGGQLRRELDNIGWDLAVDGNTAKGSEQGSKKVKNNEKVTLSGGKNMVVSRKDSTIELATSSTPEFDSVKVGNTTISSSIAQDGVNEVNLVSTNNAPTRITNVAPGVKGTDAVNVNQLNQVKNDIGSLSRKVDKINRSVRGIGASSAASSALPQAYLPGKSMLAVASGAYDGATAVSVGYSKASDNSKLILKLQGTASSEGSLSGGVGVGYQW